MKKNILTSLVIIMIMCMAIPISAAETTTQVSTQPIDNATNLPKDATTEVLVSAYIADSYTVTVPKTIKLQSGVNSTENINVKGDIASNKKIEITMPKSLTLTDRGSKTNAVEIFVEGNTSPTENKITFLDSEISDVASTKSFTLKVPKLTAGDWQGRFTLTIKVVKTA